jgi:hypothetical protein
MCEIVGSQKISCFGFANLERQKSTGMRKFGSLMFHPIFGNTPCLFRSRA